MTMDLPELPAALMEQAVILSNEPAWPAAAARAVIEFLRQSGRAVVGVDLWVAEDDHPRSLGWSQYNVPFTGDWDAYVEENALQALALLSAAEISETIPEGALFNLTWIDRTQHHSYDHGA